MKIIFVYHFNRLYIIDANRVIFSNSGPCVKHQTGEGVGNCVYIYVYSFGKSTARCGGTTSPPLPRLYSRLFNVSITP